jgi:probable phosphoglycerate mutase
MGLHLDQFQRIVVDPCSVTVIRYTELRPFVRPGQRHRRRRGRPRAAQAQGPPPQASSDASVGGGAGAGHV